MQVTQQYPIVINNRDRLKPLLQMLRWLERAQQTNIYIVDNDSTYPPLLRYYQRCPYKVIALGENVGHTAPWSAGVVERFCAGQYYVVSDPDIVPVSYCPTDALARFRTLLDKYPERDKVGFGLKIEDIPARYKFADEVKGWEGKFWTNEIEPGVYEAPLDTSFALYRPGAVYAADRLGFSLRTGEPYVARHTPWYANSRRPDAEERYYRAHTRPDLNHWDGEELPERLTAALNAAGIPVREHKDTPSWFERLIGRKRAS